MKVKSDIVVDIGAFLEGVQVHLDSLVQDRMTQQAEFTVS